MRSPALKPCAFLLPLQCRAAVAVDILFGDISEKSYHGMRSRVWHKNLFASAPRPICHEPRIIADSCAAPWRLPFAQHAEHELATQHVYRPSHERLRLSSIARARTMLSFDVATTPPAAARARIPDTAEGVEPLNRREYSGIPMKLVAFNAPGRSSAEGPRDVVEREMGFEVCLEEED